ncbi:hypothetical protein FNV43_RR24468 [Rhamnella rubrinervis]|uniref:DUF1985 domain-containing protein n=1 Tax=Rhamnella rubrinervis TaxID=2594499 RepID=A0A8K0DR88_9ROSA|nr:hypothetical protein FNV43_RR24468 [Rhamnella rubrinervis]
MVNAKPLMYLNVEHSPVKVSSKAALQRCIEEVKAKFAKNPKKPSKRKRNLEKKLSRSCFGSFITRLRNVMFSSAIVHHMILRQAVNHNPDVMEFNFNGCGAIFTIKEFDIITGLNIKDIDVPSPPKSDRIINTYFGGSKYIKPKDFRQVFLGLKFKHCVEKDDMVKLNLLYILECGILGKESQTNANLTHFSMVEDLKYFNQYPWGLVAYQATIRELHKVFGLHRGRLNPSSTYSLGGLPLAFQFDCDELKGYIQSLDTKIDRVTNEIDIKIDRVANDLNNFRLDSMWELTLLHETMNMMFDFMKKGYHSAYHDTPNTDYNKEDKGMKDDNDNENQNIQLSVVEYNDSEVMELTPSKVYIESNEDEIRDYQVCDADKGFFLQLLVEEAWLTEKQVNVITMLMRNHMRLYSYLFCKKTAVMDAFFWGNAYNPKGANLVECDYEGDAAAATTTTEEVKKSKHVLRKLEKCQQNQVLNPHIGVIYEEAPT